MLESFLPANPVIFLDSQTSADKIFTQIRDEFAIANFLSVDGADELHFVVGQPGGLPVEHFIEDESYRPEIGLVGVFLFL